MSRTTSSRIVVSLGSAGGVVKLASTSAVPILVTTFRPALAALGDTANEASRAPVATRGSSVRRRERGGIGSPYWRRSVGGARQTWPRPKANTRGFTSTVVG